MIAAALAALLWTLTAGVAAGALAGLAVAALIVRADRADRRRARRTVDVLAGGVKLAEVQMAPGRPIVIDDVRTVDLTDGWGAR